MEDGRGGSEVVDIRRVKLEFTFVAMSYSHR
jgi:hypothetical protein